MSSRITPNRSPCILKSLEPHNVDSDYQFNPSDTDLTTGLHSLNLHDDIAENDEYKSILLLDDSEQLLIKSEKSFLTTLAIEPNRKVKVVSIFGNTGEGKSYTLNQAFFNGDGIFRTSPSQTSCTLGVWAMYNAPMNTIFLDTEGLLGISKKEHQRTRMLLKILAVSDIIIYRTRAERLQRDMYTFLGGASKAYKDHFTSALKQIVAKAPNEAASMGLGPGVIVFHETRYTDTLDASATLNESPEDILRNNFASLNLTFDAFSFIKYVGVKTTSGPTSFDELKYVVSNELDSTEIRSSRDPKYIYLTLKVYSDFMK